MIRHCDGNDLNLVRYPHDINPAECPNVNTFGPKDRCGCRPNPCDCGQIFDDVDHMTIYPHQVLAPPGPVIRV